MIKLSALALLMLPMAAFADGLSVSEAWVPTAPPGAGAHAAYFTLHNDGAVPRILVGVAADGYAMSHMHESKEADGIATMAMIHQIEIPAGKTLTMAPGGLHVMLMRPDAPLASGDIVQLKLTFVNGETLVVSAEVKSRVFES
ncbi:copper chaperone PCu(A)C [Planktotalea sp.]|uniref:copper chaperone PCu(A)C n=1 Tax=Planktotalea sp. TaxID=2029877 RepID=UPI003296DB87